MVCTLLCKLGSFTFFFHLKFESSCWLLILFSWGRHIVDLKLWTGNELGGFRCNRTTTHLHCQGCGGMMPFRSDSVVPQKCKCNNHLISLYFSMDQKRSFSIFWYTIYRLFVLFSISAKPMYMLNHSAWNHRTDSYYMQCISYRPIYFSILKERHNSFTYLLLKI